MRLLYLTAETWPTYRADVTVLFGKYLPKHGIFSDIVAGLTPGQQPAPWGGGEALLSHAAGSQVGKYFKEFLHGVRHLWTLDRACYQAIQVRDMPLLAAIGLISARLKRLPFYYWMSYPMPEGQIARARERGLTAGLMKCFVPWVQGRIGYILLYKLVLPRADHVFVQSDQMRHDMMERHIAPEKMTPVPMGVDIASIRCDDIPPASDPRLVGRRVLVYLGTLDWPRRIERLFDMLALVKQEFPSALLVLVGDTTNALHRDWLKRYMQKAGVADHVVWTGWLATREAWGYVRAAEVGLSPFPRGFLLDSASPTKVPEYLALGIPVVCNDNPDQKAIIDGAGAGKCVRYTAEEFSQAVIEIMRIDVTERRAMVQRGREFIAANRDYDLLARTVAQVYLELQPAGKRSIGHSRCN